MATREAKLDSNCLPASHVLALAMSVARSSAQMVQMSAARLPAAPPALARASALARRHDRLKQRNHGLQARQLIFVNQGMGIDEFDASWR
jgi:hypothetical protein